MIRMRTEMRCYGKEKHLGDTVEMEMNRYDRMKGYTVEMVMKCNDFIRFEMEKTVVEEKEVDQI